MKTKKKNFTFTFNLFKQKIGSKSKQEVLLDYLTTYNMALNLQYDQTLTTFKLEKLVLDA